MTSLDVSDTYRYALLQAFLDLSLLDARDVKVPFLQAKKQGQAALLNYSRRTLEEQVEKGFENKDKVGSQGDNLHDLSCDLRDTG